MNYTDAKVSPSESLFVEKKLPKLTYRVPCSRGFLVTVCLQGTVFLVHFLSYLLDCDVTIDIIIFLLKTFIKEKNTIKPEKKQICDTDM